MVKLELDIMSRGVESVLCRNDCSKSLKEFKKEGYNPITLEEVAGLIINEGLNSKIANERFYTGSGILSYRGELYFLSESPIIDSTKKATKCSKKGRVFDLSEKETNDALKNSKLLRLDSDYIDINNDWEIFEILFGKYASTYRRLINKKGVSNIEIKYKNNENKKPNVNQIMFLGYDKGLLYSIGGLDNKENYWRGIKYYSP